MLHDKPCRGTQQLNVFAVTGPHTGGGGLSENLSRAARFGAAHLHPDSWELVHADKVGGFLLDSDEDHLRVFAGDRLERIEVPSPLHVIPVLSDRLGEPSR